MKLRLIPAILAVVVAATMAVDAKIKVKAQFDKTFKFQGLKTYAWDPAGVGDVKVLQADPARKPDELKAQWEPVILSSVDQAIASRGFTKAPIGTADLKVYYYVLIGAGTNAQVMGQFLPAVPQWGIPPFDASTSALEVYPQGTLIIDLSSPAAQAMVWRGSAQTEIDFQASEATREKRIRESVQDMFKKFPPK